MVFFFESVMLVCFGLSWPISVYKSLVSKSVAGKSGVFMAAILLGYVAGILGKILGGQLNYVLVLYIINFIMVSLDLCLFLRNRRMQPTT